MRFFSPIVPLSAYKPLKPQIYRALEDTTNCLLKLNISSTLTTKTCLLSLIGFKLYVLTYLWIYLMLIWNSTVVTNRTFGLAKLFCRTSSVRFGPNDRTFFCRTQNFFSYQILCQWHPFIFLFCFMTHICCHWPLWKIARRMPTEPKLEN